MESDQKKCSKCGEVKALSEFHKQKTGKFGVKKICKLCRRPLCAEYYANNKERQKDTSRRWQFANPEKKRVYSRRWQKNNPDKKLVTVNRRRAKKANAKGDHTAEQLKARFDYHGNKCVYCDSTENLHADHQIPLSRGGTNFASNMVPACATCNISKGSKKPEEFLVYQFNIAMEKLING